MCAVGPHVRASEPVPMHYQTSQICYQASYKAYKFGQKIQPAIDQIQSASVFVNKALLEHSHVHMLLYYLWLLWQSNGRAEWLQQRLSDCPLPQA